jgi:tripartite-type tricarboxylate transporter receptor subunit TctC
MRKAFAHVLCFVASLVASLALSAQCRAGEVADFYKGKTITMPVGYSAGGGYDALARLVAHTMPRHIPGHPAIVVVNEPGAGTLTLTNRLAACPPCGP